MFRHTSVTIMMLMTWKLNNRIYFLDSAYVRKILLNWSADSDGRVSDSSVSVRAGTTVMRIKINSRYKQAYEVVHS
jgi:hypothetical protein